MCLRLANDQLIFTNWFTNRLFPILRRMMRRLTKNSKRQRQRTKPLVMTNNDSCTTNLVTLLQTPTFNSNNSKIHSVVPVDSIFRMEGFILMARVVVEKSIQRNSSMPFLVAVHVDDEGPNEVPTYKCMFGCHSRKRSRVHRRTFIYGIKLWIEKMDKSK